MTQELTTQDGQQPHRCASKVRLEQMEYQMRELRQDYDRLLNEVMRMAGRLKALVDTTT